ncbi:MAG: VanZ family protein [Desulfobacterales bacterium]|nr:VanZ family protein [Desulfobacterales bacterium]MDD4392509.1 VanZ family protein [Desulfobacterales bacterium]
MLEKLYKNFILFWLPLILFCIVIFIMSSHPAPKHIPKVIHIDKVLHFMGYAVLGILFFRALSTLPAISSIRLLITLSILFSTFYGLSDEIHQYFIPHRSSDVFDLLADALGSFSGIYIFYKIRGWKILPENPN